MSPATRAAGWQWALIFGFTGGVVCLSKLAFMGWGIGSERYDFTGFSGHSALAASIWPPLLWTLTGRFSHPIRSIALLTGWILPFAIGVSRLEIRVHSVSEVISGLILGYLASALFLRLQRSKNAPASLLVTLRHRAGLAVGADGAAAAGPHPGIVGAYRQNAGADRTPLYPCRPAQAYPYPIKNPALKPGSFTAANRLQRAEGNLRRDRFTLPIHLRRHTPAS